MTRRDVALLLALGSVLAACGATPHATPAAAAPLRIGAVFPAHGPSVTVAGAAEERLGVEIASDLVNAGGGVSGQPLELLERDLSSTDQAPAVIDGLHRAGVAATVGAYSSDLSMAASAAAARQGMVYWEAGAVADRLTGRGLPLVFRVGADGQRLGDNSGQFAATVLAPRLGRPAAQLSLAVVVADDDYARSVAAAATASATSAGMRLLSRSLYNPYRPDFSGALAALRAAPPDVLVLASHEPDGVAFRRAFLAAGLHVGAFIGSTMAECVPEFGADLGADAIGVFASDRPGGPRGGFDPSRLNPTGRAAYDRLAARWAERHGGAPTEEGLAGFSAAWALFHDVLPRAAAVGDLGAEAIAAAARSTDLAVGSLADGAGVRFAGSGERIGQNTRAAAVIWQWQGVRRSVVVWPQEWRSGTIGFVPLPR